MFNLFSAWRTKRQTTPLPDERPAKRSALQTTLKTVPSDLDDATHARLDTIVLELCDEPIESSLAATCLLNAIVQRSEGRLDQKYGSVEDAKALIKEHPELVAKLKEAWNDRSFEQIRNLKILRPSQSFQTVLGIPIEQKAGMYMLDDAPPTHS
ncbi:hypothetical protein M378DRAFT_162356 [Amanita muscaria Koide BX008]|uniref:Uncharacterized protein n=1 Tax=Amanita muscaria (strain Koide BX008) TaxID=946122 RepID=A0A0C2WTQ4_AMAMK|nr:hypothetical protein M378DRAFT_162356 [Amanita muscaria Koide BX008]